MKAANWMPISTLPLFITVLLMKRTVMRVRTELKKVSYLRDLDRYLSPSKSLLSKVYGWWNEFTGIRGISPSLSFFSL